MVKRPCVQKCEGEIVNQVFYIWTLNELPFSLPFLLLGVLKGQSYLPLADLIQSKI